MAHTGRSVLPTVPLVIASSSLRNMGSTPSSPPSPICENCHKSTQKDLPADDDITAKVCHDSYAAVDKCMKENQGQISPCASLWQQFKKCRDASEPVSVG